VGAYRRPASGRQDHVGVTAADNRVFVEAVLYRYRAGIVKQHGVPTPIGTVTDWIL